MPLITSIAYRFLVGAVAVFDGFLLLAVVRAGLNGFRPLDLAAVAVAGVCMLGLAVYLAVRAPDEKAPRGLVGVLLFGYPIVVYVAENRLATLFYRAGLAPLMVRLGDTLPGGDPAAAFLMDGADFFVGLFSALAFLYLATVFPRPLRPTDIGEPRRDDGEGPVARLVRPLTLRLGRGTARLKRTLLRYRWSVVAVGLVPPVAHALEGQPHPEVCTVSSALIIVLALSYFRDGYAVAGPADRRRALWVVGGLFLAGLSLSAWAIARGILYDVIPAGLLEGVRLLALVLAPVAFGLVAAGVLYKGAFDPTLMVRRTTVYGALGILLTALFAGVEEVTTERMFGEVGLPDPVGAALAALLVVAIYRPLRNRLGGFYDAFLDRAPPDAGPPAPTILAARVVPGPDGPGPRDPDDVAGLLLERAARAAAEDRGGELLEAHDGEAGTMVLLRLPDPVQAILACRSLRERLATAARALDAPPPATACAAFRADPGVPPDPDFAHREAVAAARHMVASAGPGELVLAKELAADPTLLRVGSLEPASSSPRAGAGSGPETARFHLGNPDRRATAVRTLRAAVPVAAGALAALLLPVLLAADPATPTLQSGTAPVPTLPGDSVFDRGEALTEREVRLLTVRVAEVPGDVAARGLLLRYWCRARPNSIPRWRGHGHALRILEQRPTHPVAFRAVLCLPATGPVRERAYDLLVEHAAAPDAEPRAIAVAALLLRTPGLHHRPGLAADLFATARGRAPEDPVIAWAAGWRPE